MRTETALLLIMAALLTILSFTHGDEVCSALTQAKCSSITCGVQTNVALTPSTTGCTCKPQDLGTRFTTCDNTTSTKTLFSYYKPPAICRAASPLPQPVTDVPCSVYCKVGERFDVSTKSCVSCPSGSYSKGANIDVRKWSPKTGLLPEMRTYCEKYTWSLGCNPWIISDEGYLESGSNRLFNNIQSVLQYRVEISEPIGTFSFEYMVSSEEFFDYLYLTIDTPETRLKVSNTKNEWLTYSFNLTQGYHVISFIYRKDATETRGFDAARIRAFSVSGISEVPTECIACEPGYFGADGKECRPCPAGTFSSGSNASECHLCPAGQSSFEGSSTCFQKSIPCQEYDYTSYFTPCDPTSKTKSEVFQWTQPQICNASHPNSTDLPETITDIACSVPEKCAPGQEPSSSTYECKYCPQGQVSDGKKCVSCPTGSASQDRLVTIQKFATRDAEVRKQFISTDCSGECSSEGWRFTDVFADSGLGNGVSDSWIDIDVSDVESKQVSVTYGLTCSVGTGSLDIEIDGAQFQSIPCSGCRNVSGELSTLIIPLDKDSSKVRVNYKTRSLLSQDAFSCDRAVVTNIAIDIVDEQKGGAYQCTVCSAGEFSQSSIVCETCPPGSYSTSNSSACSECRPNTFSYEHSATCYDCGNGMVSEQGASECQWQYGQCHFNGTLFDIQREFDFEALGNILAETTASFAGEPDNTFYFNICGEKTGDRRSLKIMADDENPCAEIDGAYVCKKTKSGDVIALGRSADVRTGLYGSDLEGESGIHITFTDLSTKACLNNVTGQQENYKTIINLRCESEAERIIGPVVTTVAPCTYRIDVISNQGCPACDFNDFTALEGNCDATTLQKEIVYVKKTDKANKCAGGVEMPPKKVKCQVNVISAPYWIVAAVLGVAVLIIIALGGAALFFYYKFRDASNKFHQLSEGDENINTGRATELRD